MSMSQRSKRPINCSCESMERKLKRYTVEAILSPFRRNVLSVGCPHGGHGDDRSKKRIGYVGAGSVGRFHVIGSNFAFVLSHHTNALHKHRKIARARGAVPLFT